MSNPSVVDKNLEYIPDMIKTLSQEASDIEWNDGNAKSHWEYIRTLKEKVDNDILYEPKF